MAKRISLIASLLAVSEVFVSAQRPTIPESIERMRPQLCQTVPCAPYATSRVRELAPLPFERAVRESDLIVYGSLKKVGTYLSSSKTELYTDYELMPLSVLAQRQVPVIRTPGRSQPLIVRQWGGETILNGITVSIKDENVPFLPTATPLLLLLTYDATIGRYDVFDGGAGAFVIEQGVKLRHLVIPQAAAYERFNGMELAIAIQEIHRLGR